MRVLDCTMGLASDAVVASFITGRTGTVCAVEASPLLHFVVSEGLQNYQAEDVDLKMQSALKDLHRRKLFQIR